MGELLLQSFALADVPSIQHETADRGQLEKVGDRDLGRAVGVVHAPEPAFGRNRRSHNIDGLVDFAECLRAVVRVYKVSEALTDQPSLPVTEDPLYRGALILDFPVTVDEGDDIRRVL